MTKPSVETREVEFTDFEFRAGDGSDKMSFRGYAAVFNSPSEPLPFRETIAPGAFSRSLRSRNDVRMYVNHDSNLVLANTRSGTLRLTEDGKGLLVDADLPNTTYGRDLSVLMQDGIVDKMSFGFSVPSGGDAWNADGSERTLKSVRLHEVSVVTGFPAYAATSASVRSLDALADRTGANADALAAALTRLEQGETLTGDDASLITDVVAKLRANDPAPAAPAGAPLSVLRQQLDLLAKTL